ncbi:MAG: UDP-N-acetylmuramate--L-alanine ligase [Lachnospiraceae bacterium]|nr:UDP-N-acetylmuramate--L-alanine ligase [Lachnospiraceae bacterium]
MYNIDFTTPVHVHFLGIGGISMSGLARILMSEGFTVSGSDMKESELIDELRSLGAQIAIGQVAENINDSIDLAVYTAAISDDNPEICEVRRRGIPELSRAQLLGQLMKNYKMPINIAGTHGKTTTSSMVSEILMHASLDPTVTVGGMLKSIGGNLRIGGGEYFVAEACEYTNSFLSFFPRMEIILNIEEDHLDFFKDIEDIRASFKKFMELLPDDGCLIINGTIDDIPALTAGVKCPVVKYGPSPDCDYYPADVTFDELGRGRYTCCHGDDKFEVTLGVVGIHNVYNSLAAIALCERLGVDRAVMLEALAAFTGTDRRFEKKGDLHGITIMDDYAHHPTEIATTLAAAKNYPHKKLFLVFQPHTYTRTKAFLHEFADALSAADEVLLLDIYAAREKNTIGISSEDLLKLLLEKGVKAQYFKYFDDAETYLLLNCESGDMILTMGAGDVYRIGEKLLGK